MTLSMKVILVIFINKNRNWSQWKCKEGKMRALVLIVYQSLLLWTYCFSFLLIIPTKKWVYIFVYLCFLKMNKSFRGMSGKPVILEPFKLTTSVMQLGLYLKEVKWSSG